VLFADALDTRGDLSELRRRAPRLATEFAELREAINRADHVRLPGPDHRRATELRGQLRGRWNSLLEQIRRVRGLEDFLLPPSLDELSRAAAEGLIVYVTVHRDRGHALILADDAETPVQPVELDGLTRKAAREQGMRFYDGLSAATDRYGTDESRDQGQQSMLAVLG
jgi:hypothetical protein